MEKLKIKTAIQISKPAKEIYEAITDPERMKNYFISSASSGMKEGKEITWKFAESNEQVKVKVVQLTPEEYISFLWEGEKAHELLVEITLLNMPSNSTLVRVTEGELPANAQGIKWMARNTEGWANFLASLKAYLEYGINLRKGAFDFMKNPTASAEM